jgi:crossover junction endodeoxyribonuclease RuvC
MTSHRPARAVDYRPSDGGLILGIDPGLQRCGYAVVSVRTRRVLDAGVIVTAPRRPLAERLREIEEGLQELLTARRIDRVAIEDLYAHYKHPRTAILMGHARGVVLLVAARHGAVVENLGATHVKKALTGNGHAGKRQVQRAIMLSAGLSRPPEPPDVADAIAVALAAAEAGSSRIRSSIGQPRYFPARGQRAVRASSTACSLR